MTHKVLIVEDDTEIARLTDMLLSSEGYQCSVVHRGDEAEDQVKLLRPDLVILDIMLPGMSGVQVCESLRKFYHGAILILTGQDDDITELTSFKTGADDYVLKPIKPHLLLARIEALLKRTSNQLVSSGEIVVGKMRIFPEKRQVQLGDVSNVELTTAEFDLLLLLANHKGNIVSREECSSQLRGISHDAMDRSIDMRVSSLRRKLSKASGGKELIVTVRNRGYMLINDD